jgi:hypothetical protein
MEICHLANGRILAQFGKLRACMRIEPDSLGGDSEKVGATLAIEAG